MNNYLYYVRIQFKKVSYDDAEFILPINLFNSRVNKIHEVLHMTAWMPVNHTRDHVMLKCYYDQKIRFSFSFRF